MIIKYYNDAASITCDLIDWDMCWVFINYYGFHWYREHKVTTLLPLHLCEAGFSFTSAAITRFWTRLSVGNSAPLWFSV